MYLEKINSPADLKCLSMPELETLSEEIRAALFEMMRNCGGHFGPNMGVVEATVALHYVFNSPIDKIVFDVSHQCYVHKMLTGRREAYTNPERYNTVTGFTNPKESEHDFFTVGHTSTSISLVSGLAKARDLKGEKGKIIAFIGDGSLSGGMAFEGLNNVGHTLKNVLVVVNDNDMAIAEAHGALSVHLRQLRESKGQCSDNYFKSLGFEYVYIEEGNNPKDLIAAFKVAKDTTKPIVVHIFTRKGKGYKIAEDNYEKWHYHLPFDVATGNNLRTFSGENYDDIAADYILQKMQNDKRVALITPAVPLTVGFTKEYRDIAGEQYVDVGIAEEHAISMAAGLAKNGCKPIVASHSTFYQRMYDQISQELCINKCPATLLLRNGSVWGARDETHLGFFDIALLANIPNLVYLCPTNVEEYLAMLEWSIEQTECPVVIRIPRNGVHHTSRIVPTDYSRLNKSEVVIEGEKVAIFALGDFFQLGEQFADAIKHEFGFTPTLINPRFASGIDVELLERLKANHHLVITIEDGIVEGGFGSKIATYYGDSDIAVKCLGLQKEFMEGYSPNEVLKQNGICEEFILAEIKEYIQ